MLRIEAQVIRPELTTEETLLLALPLVALVAMAAWGVLSIRRTRAKFASLTATLGLVPISHQASVWLEFTQLSQYIPPWSSRLARGRRGEFVVELGFNRSNRSSPDNTIVIVARPDAVAAAAVFRLMLGGGLGLLYRKVSVPALGSGFVWSEAECTAVARIHAHVWEMLASLPRKLLAVHASPGMFFIQWKGHEGDPRIVEQAFRAGAEATRTPP